MKTIQRLVLTWAIMMVTTIITMPNAYAKDQAAVVIIAAGDFYAVNATQQKRSLQRRSKVYVGETLVTGNNGRGQVRFIDGAVLSLRPDTELKIHSYRYGKTKSDEGSWMSLIKGGFRTITGAISKKKYKVTTSMATIGIRGTHYEAVISNEQLYVALWDGGVTLSNNAGKVDLGLGADYNFGMVQGENVEPQGQLDPPAAIVNDSQPDIAPDLSKSSSDDAGSIVAAGEPVLIDDIAQSDISTIMPTSGTATYLVDNVGGTGSVSASGTTDSIGSFTYNATVDFAAATISGNMVFNSTTGINTSSWDIAFNGGPTTGNGVNGSNFSMTVDTASSLVNGADPVSGTISGAFTGANAENMVGSFNVVNTNNATESAQGNFTATQ